ncbi:unnamed protein product [Phytophthora lilii]|uniref:RxLR effector protein n=1 Tax=Phytophthora lilii TaxID=2077276 RepID=A0A9W7DA16_9STRA|nr:unnamed protein product [Phytophthora lilii]
MRLNIALLGLISIIAVGEAAATNQTESVKMEISDLANNKRILRSQTITKADDGADEERGPIQKLLRYIKSPNDFAKEDIMRMENDSVFAKMMFEKWDKHSVEKVISKVGKRNGNLLLQYLNRPRGRRDGTIKAD